ncbi:hypothetical protein BD289DRAFT_40891 [Coniella lustricola]|uniref:Uncharacterized protein n=1 Tax=Coniella lustricola TaxID=2025994 RepID=A0A2T3A208_9PEZI|nr:hypothetical protein BD289DRAFT_40891 [Coniella lustricola]
MSSCAPVHHLLFPCSRSLSRSPMNQCVRERERENRSRQTTTKKHKGRIDNKSQQHVHKQLVGPSEQ